MNKKYDRKDFELIVERRKTLEQVAKKYGVSTQILHRQMNRAGYYISKRKIIIISPYQLTECDSVNECARQLGVSTTTIHKALKGEKPRILQELEITIKEEKPDENYI